MIPMNLRTDRTDPLISGVWHARTRTRVRYTRVYGG